ncbi:MULTISPECIES: hypothetical protein [unclassified Actinomyces]|uniref:hypothetical protein n=1 Tax=unclassified Actinomyces TaxID=2609248 RepID=UPI002016C50F|nr:MULTISPECIES: hypothetical protein [unclassified Actinomyces]MCL3777080.1 hypothetical protein [Actinomyces sp. AC-20-1]MCL3789908.1 hypothetical protein [Actinomyces sp. 187325]MCL3792994.1 hypothetical protein [Actinomyces sp. 186855]MCL3795410.1 hypothetical protein [Actinomyces sp. 217892]
MILVAATPCTDPPPPGVLVPQGPDPAAAVARALDVLSEDAVLVVTDDDADRPARIADQVTASQNVALVRLGGTTTQRALAVHGLAALAPRQYGLAQALADALIAACRTRVALSSVARITSPRPSLWQHVRSLVGGSFEADLTAGTVTTTPTMTWSTSGAGVAAWSASASTGRLHLAVEGPLAPVVVPAQGSPWGSRYWAELTLLPDLPSVVRGALGSAATVSCRLCGRLVADSGCPFCRTAVSARTTSAFPIPTRERQPQ